MTPPDSDPGPDPSRDPSPDPSPDPSSAGRSAPDSAWPALPWEEWRDTCATLHMWTQIVGKIRVARAPWVNHSWHVTLHPTPTGLRTPPIPHGRRTFDLEFDLHAHELRVSASDGATAPIELRPRSVADFHDELMSTLDAMDLHTEIHGSPNEVAEPIPFAEDETHASYDADAAHRFARVIASSARVLEDFRGGFIGKSSPVHFFWGAFDLAVTRFSGRRAPPHPGGFPHMPDWITREAYSHEVSSAGFWPGDERLPEPAYYSYAYPMPEGMPDRHVRPAAAAWSEELGEFVLPYEAVRSADDPEAELMAFLESTYEVAAELGGWDREALEWAPGERPEGSPGER